VGVNSRSALIAFAEQNQIPIAKDKRGEAPFSVDANSSRIFEGKVLEDPHKRCRIMLFPHASIRGCANEPEYVEIDFARGDATASMARHCRSGLLAH